MKNYFKIAKLMFTADKKLLCKCLLVVILFLGLETAVPIYMEWMIDQTEAHGSVPVFVCYMGIFVAAYLMICILNALKSGLYERLGRHILWKTREKIYNVLWNSDYSTYIRDNKEKFKFILSNETFNVYAFTTIYTVGIVLNTFTVIVFLIVSFLINPIVAVVLLLSILATFSLSFISGPRMLNDFGIFEDAREADTIVNNETVDMTEVARTNGLTDYYLAKNLNSLNNYSKVAEKANKTDAFWTSLEQAIHTVIYVLVAGVSVLTGSYTGGQLVTVLFIANYLLQQSQDLQHQVQVLIKNLPSFGKVMEVAEIPIKEGSNIERIESIKFDSVSLKFSNGRDVFENVSFCLKTGEHAIIEGVNGSGKSSILKMIVGLLTPTEGIVEINGRNILDYDCGKLYREISYISQDELFLNETVEDYLRIISHSDITDESISLLRERMRLNPEINRITDNGNTLSGGEKKKMLLLKCLLQYPNVSVIILDEIDAGLDGETKELLSSIEKELLSDSSKIVIKISHIDTSRDGYNKIIRLRD